MQETNEYQRARASLESYGVFASGTLGRSMRPLFREGKDVVIVCKHDLPPKKYDVVLYERAGKCVLHRVIKKCGDVNIIRGDNTYALEYVNDRDILGILMEFDRGKKHHTVMEHGYKIYSVIWNFIYPLRHAMVILKSLPRRIFRKLFSKKR
ncbi:MAG: S24/S26 family peptidase [Clostridia bacterium]|nr:S24/S26 family peptidase [Clostridia bacterium]